MPNLDEQRIHFFIDSDFVYVASFTTDKIHKYEKDTGRFEFYDTQHFCNIMMPSLMMDTLFDKVQYNLSFLSESCCGKAMVAYAIPSKRRKQKATRRGKQDQVYQ